MDKKIVYIIPLHKKDKKVLDAIVSIPEGSAIVVATTPEIQVWLSTKKVQVEFANSDVTTYPALVNAGLSYAKSLSEFDLVSILEFDDKLMPNAHTIINEYANDWWDDVEIFAPLACVVKEDPDIDEDKPVLVGIANEASMAPQVAEEFGFFDFNMMLRTNFIFMNGCYIKPSVFEDYGNLKENFELFYDYEWTLRVVYNGGIVRSIPKATHFHTLSDDGAFETQKVMPREVRENWLGAARREYFFEEDREISFD